MTQWTAAQCTKAQLAGLEAMAGLTNAALEDFERVVTLNLQTMMTTLAQTQEGVMKALSAQSPQELVNLQIEQAQPAADNVLRYRGQLHAILATTRVEFEKVIEGQYATGNAYLHGLIEGVVSNAPASSAAPLAAWHEVISMATAFCESMQSTAKQAAQVAESSFNTAAEATAKDMRRRTAQALPATAR
ncbi:phasin [Ralstonia solanacearum]|nr:phasin [Ralstonia solanacearum]